MSSFAPSSPAVVSDPARDPLEFIECRIARRADEIARSRPPATRLNLHCWLLAEAEIWKASGIGEQKFQR